MYFAINKDEYEKVRWARDFTSRNYIAESYPEKLHS